MKTNKPMKIFNPFYWIAGYKSLIIGLCTMLLIAILSSYSGVFFDGAIDIHLAPVKGKLLLHIYYQISTWLIFSLFIFLAIRVFTSSKPRAVDVFGTVAMSQLPLIFAALWGFTSIGQIANIDLTMNLQELPIYLFQNIIPLLISVIVLLTLTIWSLILKYNAFSVCGHIRGTKAVLIFIGLVIVVEIISQIANYLILKTIF